MWDDYDFCNHFPFLLARCRQRRRMHRDQQLRWRTLINQHDTSWQNVLPTRVDEIDLENLKRKTTREITHQLRSTRNNFRCSAQIFTQRQFDNVRAHFRLLASWHQRAVNEVRDVASLWKHRGLTSILKCRVLPSSLHLRHPFALFLLPGLRRSTSAYFIQS